MEEPKCRVVDKIVESAEITKNDLVIEIGPGLGNLTEFLLEKAGKVIAIELDQRMLEILNDRFSLYDNFEIINEDVLKVNLNELISKNKNSKIKNGKDRCIYAYEFVLNDKKYIYVGLTVDSIKRDKEHRTNSNSAVYCFSKRNNIEISEMKIIIDYED